MKQEAPDLMRGETTVRSGAFCRFKFGSFQRLNMV